jgi:hypothetical protein
VQEETHVSLSIIHENGKMLGWRNLQTPSSKEEEETTKQLCIPQTTKKVMID